VLQKTIHFKKFTLLTLLLIAIYIIYHISIWTFYSSKIFGREDGMYIGDLGRMSYQVDSLYPRKLHYTLEKRILNTKPYQNQKVDILTIGDSFSNGVMGGKNPYYQDFLATKYNLNILNIMNITNKQHKLFETIISLYNNGWLKEHKPKLVIIESAQRGVYERFAKEFDFSQSDIAIDKLIVPVKTKDSFIPNLSMINTANYKTPFYTIKYKFKVRAQKDVVKLNLSKNLFSTQNYQHSLLFHYSDILYIKNNQNLVNKINENFNHLANLLQTLDIKLLFLVAPDKYSVYYDYIENNPFQENKFFTLINPLHKDYLFIDTQTILRNSLQAGMLDLYYSDDTHWSYKASDMLTNDSIFHQFK
jgi:hypothetical protein